MHPRPILCIRIRNRSRSTFTHKFLLHYRYFTEISISCSSNLGSASLKWYRVWTPAFAKQKGLPNLRFDFYQCHYYSWMDPWSHNNDPDLGTTHFSPLQQDAAALNLDRPMVVGELPSGTQSQLVSHQLALKLTRVRIHCFQEDMRVHGLGNTSKTL